MLLYLIFILLLFALLLYVQILRNKYEFAEELPTIEPYYPLLGNGLMFLGKSAEERFESFVGAFQRTDRLLKLWFGPRLVLGTCHPELVHKILSHPDCIERPFFFYRYMRMTKGLLVARHDLWKIQRKALNSTFNLRILNSFIPIFESCSEKLVGQLKMVSSEGSVNLFHYISKCTLEMVCGTTLGIEHLQDKGGERFLFHLDRAIDIIGRRILSLHLQFTPVYYLMYTFWQEVYSSMVTRKYSSEIIEKRRAKLLNETTNKDLDEDQEDYHKPQIFLDQILSPTRTGKTFDDEEIQHNVRTMIAAGNDTSALAIAHGCLWLAMYPEVQQRVYDEIQTNVPSLISEMTPDTLKSLVYMEMFLKEVLRLSGPAPNIARETLTDIVLDGMVIPKGTHIILCLHAMHRRVDIWGPNAHRFDPKNFNEENCQKRSPGAFIPFSSGPRDCIGGRYAMISMKIMMVYILRNFKLSTKIRPEELRYKFGPTLKLAFDHLVKLERRDE